MPRRSLLTPAERSDLLSLPADGEELVRRYTFSEPDLSIIRQRRGGHNRLGFAVQLCYLRYPGLVLPLDAEPSVPLLSVIGQQLRVEPALWSQYARRLETRREHLLELQAWLKLRPITIADYRRIVRPLAKLAQQIDRAIVLAEALLEMLRQQRILMPPMEVIERVCSEALTRGTRQVYKALTTPLSGHHREALENLLTLREGTKYSSLMWLRQPPGAPRPKHVLAHLDRLKDVRELKLPVGLEHAVHQNRLMKLAREGGQMTAQHLRNLEPLRRHATLAAVVVLDTRATLIDEIIDLHDRFMGSLFSKAKRKHEDRFVKSGKAINDKVRMYSRIGRALLDAKQTGSDPYAAIEAIVPWHTFSKSITEAEKLAQPEDFDFLALVGDGFNQLRRYASALLESLTMKAAPAARDLLAAVEVLKGMNDSQSRTVPDNAPTSFARKRWQNLVRTPDGLDRRFYELCVLSELKNSLRSGDIWVQGSRQFKDFEEYLLAPPRFTELRDGTELGLAVETNCERYLDERMASLNYELANVERLAAANALPGAQIKADGQLSISPLENAVPEEAEAMQELADSLLPRVKITDLLLEVASWTNFTRHFTHFKTGETAKDGNLLLTVILADAINLGLTKMADSCPSTTYAKLAWLQMGHIRDETYSAALAELVNAQYRQPFAAYWGDGTTSSSDGQNFVAGGRGHATGHVNLKYGQQPGVQFYTHISDQYAPFHTKVISASIRDATFVLDGLLYHESDLAIEEHYTDSTGFTDHVFALMHLLGYTFSPRIKDFADKRLYVFGNAKSYPTLAGLISGNIDVKRIRGQWAEILRLAASIKHGTVTAPLMLRKFGSYPRQNGLALALRELGRIERTLSSHKWMRDPEQRRRTEVGLNKGEARNSLARAVCIDRLGEIRDRTFESQRYRASGLNLVVAAIVLWNTVYLERAVRALRKASKVVDDSLLPHLSPLPWGHISLTGDYVWRPSKRIQQGLFRPLRKLDEP